jgi:hypothetical protein
MRTPEDDFPYVGESRDGPIVSRAGWVYIAVAAALAIVIGAFFALVNR